MALNAANVYSNSKIQTASPAELTLMLYEGAIKFCNIAIMGLEKNDLQKATINTLIEDHRASQEWYKKQLAEKDEEIDNLIKEKTNETISN